jgi:gamma-glutamyltranspeptidase/glutathione hydrolase
MAEVLDLIARKGRAGFYDGVVAEDMVNSLQALGGVHTLDDFADTECTYSKPISGNYRGTELVEHPPNGQGATAILMNNILAHFDIASLDPLGSKRAHLEAEACKLAYDARNRFLADPDYTSRLSHMMSLETAAELAGLIDPNRAMQNPSTLTEEVHRETIHITVVDRDRNIVSLIFSVFHSFGSGLASDRYGINFHNRGLSFSLEPGHPNELGGGKRPMHTIIPAMLRQGGQTVMSFGVMGGSYQANGHARFMSNLLDFGMSPQEAIDAPRCFSEAGVLRIERGYARSVVAALAEMGHHTEVSDMPIGGAQAIAIDPDTGVLQGGSDARKDGLALGY